MFKTCREFRGFKADGFGAYTFERFRLHTTVHVLRVLCLRRFFSLHEGLEVPVFKLARVRVPCRPGGTAPHVQQVRGGHCCCLWLILNMLPSVV